MTWRAVRRSLVAVAAKLVVGATLGAQPSTRTLPSPDAEFPAPFTSISGLRELPDGRVLVADMREKVLLLLDLARGTSSPVGREGAGPNEWAVASTLHAAPGDSTLMVDAPNNRFFRIAPSGVPAGTARFPEALPIFSSEVLGIDTGGRIILFAPRQPSPRHGPSTGVAEVLRYNPRTQRVDTVASLALPRGEVSAGRILPGGRMQMVTNLPLSARDLAGVAPDGRVAVVRATPYRIEWIAPDGTRRIGPDASPPNVRVTEAEKRAYVASQVVAGPVLVRGPGAAAPSPGDRKSRPSSMRPADIETLLNPSMTWPEVKPPFLDRAVYVAPDGHVWVLRTRAHDDPVPTYDVFDGAGRVVERVALPTRSRLLGFGKGTVYLARSDEDELLWLQRVRR